MITETVYRNRDNIISLALKARTATGSDSLEQDISASTRMQLLIGQTLIDSQLSPGAFDWDTAGASGQLDLDIGMEKGLRLGTYRARLTIYDTTYPNGLVWGFFMLNVKEG